MILCSLNFEDVFGPGQAGLNNLLEILILARVCAYEI